jgi:hypothetical protein
MTPRPARIPGLVELLCVPEPLTPLIPTVRTTEQWPIQPSVAPSPSPEAGIRIWTSHTLAHWDTALPGCLKRYEVTGELDQAAQDLRHAGEGSIVLWAWTSSPAAATSSDYGPTT